MSLMEWSVVPPILRAHAIVGHREELFAVFVKKLLVIRKSSPVMCTGTKLTGVVT
jgi:hypothetical protein